MKTRLRHTVIIASEWSEKHENNDSVVRDDGVFNAERFDVSNRDPRPLQASRARYRSDRNEPRRRDGIHSEVGRSNCNGSTCRQGCHSR